MPTHRRATTGVLLSLLLAAPAAGGPLSTFEAHIRRAAHEGGLGQLEVRVGASNYWDAWVFPPIPVVWVEGGFLAEAPDAELCRTAYHEACHLWLEKHGQADDDAHHEVRKCMRHLGAGRCVILEGQ